MSRTTTLVTSHQAGTYQSRILLRPKLWAITARDCVSAGFASHHAGRKLCAYCALDAAQRAVLMGTAVAEAVAESVAVSALELRPGFPAIGASRMLTTR